LWGKEQGNPGGGAPYWWLILLKRKSSHPREKGRIHFKTRLKKGFRSSKKKGGGGIGKKEGVFTKRKKENPGKGPLTFFKKKIDLSYLKGQGFSLRN